ncbi:ATP-dependent RNA helicase HrpA [Pseudokineococcus lusitanus]|uniref:ATP-dependent helicase HrpA n=1 Tax=Pseudokineococcus lusitanus TaxID=763993 RepID=A0A3N1HLP5_9ACTN|nr:ATP-dependent RNA helicase HrpA [Pseudokineococcus lusitanus]ROP43396.1 ATP-dependent helicase HrpA [Pseudokineococcus lusitanus]
MAEQRTPSRRGSRRGGRPPGAGRAPAPVADTPQTAALRAALAEVGVADGQRLERRLDGALRRPGPERGAALERVAADVETARERLAVRRTTVPAISYPPELPVSGARDEIAAAIRDHQVVVVAGETGSGKTTQLPKICLELGRGARGMIGHTQPRRIAARAVAERVAEELAVPLGEQVGYAVRFTDRVSDRTLVSVVTDGILLAEVQRDPMLSRYDTVIIDEAHERSLNIDFLLGILHRLLPRRPDLKLVITSATIDPRRFADHFADVAGEVPVIEVSGRTFPVEVRYRPLVDDTADADAEEDDDEDDDRPARAAKEPVQAVCDAVRELAATGPGDVLVFLPGEREIRETADAVARMQMRGTEVLPLYARLTGAEQHRVFSAHGPGVQRRVVLSTNVAETSLTVPGIRYVVDAGLARVSRYSARLKVQRLPVEAVSQASANQRSGRCGRVAEGVAIRLYSEADYEGRPRFTDPEVLRTSLASVILQMAALGLGRVEDFPFVDPPDRRQVADGLALLTELGAIETTEGDAAAERGPAEQRQLRLTPVGRRLARLPLDPRLARMVVEADRNSCVAEVLVLAAALSVQDPRERPAEHQQAADAAHARFRDERSDLLTLLALWRYLHAQQETLSSSAFRRMCKREFLSWLRVREWQDVHRQLRQLTRSLGVDASSSAVLPDEDADVVGEADDGDAPEEDVLPGSEQQVDADRVHASVLAGFLSSIGMREERTKDPRAKVQAGRDAARPDRRERRNVEYLGARGARFALWPGSVLARKPPAWVMAAELVETSRLWARGVAAIQPEWVEALAGHLVRRTYSEPHWSKKRASVVASERVLLHGLPLVAARTIAYGRVDPVTSRDLFIRHALVEGDWVSTHRFLDDNRALLDEAEDLEHRTRTRGLVVDEEALVAFYDARVPADVVSGAHFDRWWKGERRRRPDLLTFDPSALLADAAAGVQVDDFPLLWRAGELDLRVSYRFAPGEEDDGATVHVPLRALAQLDPEPFAWQVPGLRHELVTALVRGLPKAVRRHLAPAPDRAEAVLAVAGPADGPVLEVLSRELERLTGTPVPLADWDPAALPDHLRVRFTVEDDDDRAADGSPRVLGTSRDLLALRRSLTADVRRAVSAAASDLERGGARDADAAFATGALPEEVSTAGVAGYPALTDEGDAVAVRVYPTAGEARAAQRAGTLRLLRLELPTPGKDVVRRLSNTDLLTLARSPHGSTAALLDDVWDAVLADLVRRAGGPPTDPEGHAALREQARTAGPGAVAAAVGVVVRVLRSAAEVEERLGSLADGAGAGLRALAVRPALEDLRAQLAGLVHPRMVTAAGLDRLPDLQRYLQGMLRRVASLPGDAARDRDRTGVVQRSAAEVEAAVAALPASRRGDDDVREVRWTLEELRVSLFAQGLPTRGSVSPQRVTRALAALPRDDG